MSAATNTERMVISYISLARMVAAQEPVTRDGYIH